MRLTRPSLVHRRIGSSEKQGPVIAIRFQIKAGFKGQCRYQTSLYHPALSRLKTTSI
jgi:hypothetical protein